MEKSKTVSKQPGELVMHPRVTALIKRAKNDDGFRALVEDIRERGIDQPIIIDSEDQIVDGGDRWEAAKLLQLETIECIVCDQGEVMGIIVGNLVHRKHYTKGALAYVVFPLFENLLKESNARRVENLRNANKSSKGAQHLSVRSAEQLGQDLGFNKQLFYQARELHKTFSLQPDLRGLFEPQILSGEIGLGACIAGIAGKIATDGKARRVAQQLELFSNAFDTLKTRFSYWQSFDSKQKAALFPVLKETVAAMPADLRDELARALKAAGKGD